jgi:hypothetical protein
MKKVVGLLLVLVLVIGGCALFQKPPATEDEKKLWIQNTQDALDRGNLGEMAAYTIFGIACAAQRLSPDICFVGSIADKEWNKNCTIAKDAVKHYGTGELTQTEAQKLVDYALLTTLKEVMSALMPAQKVVEEQTKKTRSTDLLVPFEQKKK